MIFNSIRLRISAASVTAIIIALFAANFLIGNLFKEHATKQFESAMQSQLYQLASLIQEDQSTEKIALISPVGEPRWTSPFSGLYWQIDLMDGHILRSRSLWDLTLNVNKPINPGAEKFTSIDNFNNQSLLVLSKNLSINEKSNRFTLIVAADTNELSQSILNFQASIKWYLFILAFVLLAILFLQITLGLSPLITLKNSLNSLRKGDVNKIEGVFPSEFNSLVSEFNIVLERNQKIVEKARTQAGNLAHAIKTPIAVISNALTDKNLSIPDLKELVNQQISIAKEQIDWNLAKARAATAARNPRLKTLLPPVIYSIVRVMEKVYVDKLLKYEIHVDRDAIYIFNGEEKDLQEMLGNIIDNASKWAKSLVQISVQMLDGNISIVIEDDGVGVHPKEYLQVMKRGFRADELIKGSGLGLSIVDDLVSTYDGFMNLDKSELGGLRVSIQLPTAY